MEQRLVRSCRDLIGVNVPRTHRLLQGHKLLGRFAARHELVSPGDAAQTEKELSRRRQPLDAV